MKLNFKLEASSNKDPSVSEMGEGLNQRGRVFVYESHFVETDDEVDEARHRYKQDTSIGGLMRDKGYCAVRVQARLRGGCRRQRFLGVSNSCSNWRSSQPRVTCSSQPRVTCSRQLQRFVEGAGAGWASRRAWKQRGRRSTPAWLTLCRCAGVDDCSGWTQQFVQQLVQSAASTPTGETLFLPLRRRRQQLPQIDAASRAAIGAGEGDCSEWTTKRKNVQQLVHKGAFASRHMTVDSSGCLTATGDKVTAEIKNRLIVLTILVKLSVSS